MSSSHYLPDYLNSPTKAMMFIDGENLAIRYKELIGKSNPATHVCYQKDTFVWSRYANIHNHTHCEVLRKYYYTACQGDENKLKAIEFKLKEYGVESPKVFKKKRGRQSKRVDITLATDMLTHAHRKNYDIAILVAGDDDYVPLVQAIKSEGRRVVLWFFENSSGLSEQLKLESDYFFDLSWFLLKEKSELKKYY